MVEETSDLSELVERVAALDLGKATLTACVRVPHAEKPGRRCQEVREYGTTTRALLALAGDLRGHGVTLVAMEATSDYWKPVFYLLEAEGFTCWLLNARHVKNVPGRPKTDLLTELRGGFWRVSGRVGVWVPTVADRDRRRGCAAGSVAAGGAAGRVA
jgi:transposase